MRKPMQCVQICNLYQCHVTMKKPSTQQQKIFFEDGTCITGCFFSNSGIVYREKIYESNCTNSNAYVSDYN